MAYSALDLSPFTTFTDLWESSIVGKVAYDVASRSIAYATSTQLQNQNDDDMFDMDDFNLKNVGKKASEIAQKVGKEFVDGMSVIGERGYQAISNYINGEEKEGSEKYNLQDGVVMLRRLQLPNHPVLHHFKAHKHALANISFSPSQTLLLTASIKGTNICAWSLLNCFQAKSQPQCVMKFHRGYTSALITHVSMSVDSQWLTCTTSRGTTHLYQCDPAQQSISPCCRINSRNSIQVMKSFLSPDSESLGTSPMVKPSSSMDHATSDLGFDEFVVDTFKNVCMTAFMPLQWTKLKPNGTDLYQKRLPLLCWNPFGKLTSVRIEITHQIDPGRHGTRLNCTENFQAEWTVARQDDWEESTGTVMKR
jgi:hypothetical protein